MIHSKARLAIELSKLNLFKDPDHLLEQYPTDSEIAAEVLWDANFKDDIEAKLIADLGCGTGILGIGALLLDAAHVTFLDNDEKALVVLKENLTHLEIVESRYTIIHADVASFDMTVDTILQNPPFGTRTKHADRAFLEVAVKHTRTIYSFHKATSGRFIKAFSADHQFKVSQYYEFDFPIKATQLFHTRRIKRIKVGCWRLEKIDIAHFQ